MSIQVKNLKHIYGKETPYESVALKDITFDIADGEFVGLIGHTGSGKSTLIQHINGILKPEAGSIVIDGVDITKSGVKLLDIRKKIGLVFQYPEYQLFEETVEKDVAYGPKNLGLDDKEIDRRVKEAIRLVGLDFEEIAQRSPFELSGGQKRRIAIAGVLAMKPKVLILDEPTAGLDPQSKKELLTLIKNIHKTEKNIMILVSHNMTDVAQMSDRVFVMDSGKLVLNGTPEEVFEKREVLQEIGLTEPYITGIMRDLKDRGFDLDYMTFDIKEASDRIFKALGERKIYD